MMEQNAIRVGDPINVQVSTFAYGADMLLTVVGGIDYFPTWYPDEDEDTGPVIVGNLE